MTAHAVTRRTGWRSLVHAIALGLSTGMLLVVAGLAVVLVVVPKVTGSIPLTVLTQSMEPALPPGTLLVVRPTPLDAVRVGDVLTYQIRSGHPEVISHRVVSVASSSNGERTFVVKGDANAEPDAPVRGVQVRGVVWYSVPVLGSVNQVVNGSRGWLVPLVAGVLIAYGVVMVTIGAVSAVRRRRTGRRRAEHHHVGRHHGRRRADRQRPERVDARHRPGTRSTAG